MSRAPAHGQLHQGLTHILCMCWVHINAQEELTKLTTHIAYINTHTYISIQRTKAWKNRWKKKILNALKDASDHRDHEHCLNKNTYCLAHCKKPLLDPMVVCATCNERCPFMSMNMRIPAGHSMILLSCFSCRFHLACVQLTEAEVIHVSK